MVCTVTPPFTQDTVLAGHEYRYVFIPDISWCSVESGSHSIKEGILDRQYYEEAYLPNIARVATEKLGI